jgi:hypothetical protein
LKEKGTSLMNSYGRLALLTIAILSFIAAGASAQDIPGLIPVDSYVSTAMANATSGIAATPPQPGPTGVTVASGTHVMMQLTSPLHTTSGTQNSGVYLEIVQPVIQGDRIVIPAHTQVQGVVEANKRPGHFSRTAEFKFRFNTLIFPNNRVSPIDGALQSVAGSRVARVDAADGKLKTVDQADKVAVAGVIGATGGAIFGSVAQTGIGKFIGAGLGAGLGMETVLVHKGEDINLVYGTQLEMVLTAPVSLDADQLAFNARYMPPPVPPPPPAVSDAGQRRARRRPPATIYPLLLPGLLHLF